MRYYYALFIEAVSFFFPFSGFPVFFFVGAALSIDSFVFFEPFLREVAFSGDSPLAEDAVFFLFRDKTRIESSDEIEEAVPKSCSSSIPNVRDKSVSSIILELFFDALASSFCL